MKKLTIFNIFTQNNNPLEELMDEKMSAVTSLELLKITDKLTEEFTLIEKVRQKLLKDIFGINDDGTLIDKDNSEKISEFNKEFNEILEQEIEIEKVDIEAKTISITPKDMLVLRDFINFK